MATRNPLAEYDKKRNFERTPEPKGARKASSQRSAKLGYVIQKHAATRLHYDFRLELEGVLKSWAVTRGPSLDPHDKRLAVRTEDHPLEYGGFEGVIPKGQYGGGSVMLWDRGTWEPMHPAEEGLEAGKLHFRLHGERLKGEWALVRMRGKRGEKRENWLLIKVDDEEAETRKDPTKAWATSVASGREMEEIADAADAVWSSKSKSVAKPSKGKASAKAAGVARSAKQTVKPSRFAFTPPQLATLVEQAPTGKDWIHEIKLDGYRAQAAIVGGEVRIYSRQGLDWTDRFAALKGPIEALGLDDAVLDGEAVVVGDDGRTDFGALQRAMKSGDPLNYYVFDLLRLDGEDLTSLPLSVRKARLRPLLVGAPPAIRFSDHIDGEGESAQARACELGVEGLVSKRADAPYESGRSRSWLKVKCDRRQEAVIGGWRPSDKPGRAFSSLLLGTYDGGKLRYRGRVGTGFDEADQAAIFKALKAHERKTPPFLDAPPEAIRQSRWTTPRMLAEVRYTEITSEGYFRHPVFLGLREDKEVEEAPLEEPRVAARPGLRAVSAVSDRRRARPAAISGVSITHPDRVLFPDSGVTKADVADYLEAVAEPLLEHAAGRALTLVRCPDGSSKECFFQKHKSKGWPEQIRVVKIREKDGAKADYMYVDDAEGLRACAQMGVLELHVWGSHIDDLERPDRLVFDLDPAEDLGFPAVREAAVELRTLLGAAGLETFAMLTGGKGVHVVAPLTPNLEWPEVKAFARGFAEAVAAAAPDRYLARASKAERKGRIFIDWMRNERGATAVTPYSMRAREGATVAAPVRWNELGRIKSAAAYDIPGMRRRLAALEEDPWKGYFSVRQTIPEGAFDFVTPKSAGSAGARRTRRR